MSAWSLDTLKEHFDALRAADKEAVATALDAAKEAVNAALTASEKAILKAENASDKRAEASNEIRAAMMDQQKHFASKEQLEMLKEQISKLEFTVNARGNQATGGSNMVKMAAIIIAAIAAINGIIFVIQGAAS